MSLFVCSSCGCVDNTALTNFNWDVRIEKKPALCSECDPAIGKWHGEFPKRKYDPAYHTGEARGVINPPKEPKP